MCVCQGGMGINMNLVVVTATADFIKTNLVSHTFEIYLTVIYLTKLYQEGGR